MDILSTMKQFIRDNTHCIPRFASSLKGTASQLKTAAPGDIVLWSVDPVEAQLFWLNAGDSGTLDALEYLEDTHHKYQQLFLFYVTKYADRYGVQGSTKPISRLDAMLFCDEHYTVYDAMGARVYTVDLAGKRYDFHFASNYILEKVVEQGACRWSTLTGKRLTGKQIPKHVIEAIESKFFSHRLKTGTESALQAA